MILMFNVIFVSVLQRPSDDLMSQSPMVTNGTSPPHLSGSDNDAKKVSTLSISLSAGPGKAVTFSDPPLWTVLYRSYRWVVCVEPGWDRVGFRCCVVDRRHLAKLLITHR